MSNRKSKFTYQTRRERLQKGLRVGRLGFIFGAIFIALFVIMNWRKIADWWILTF